MVENIEDVTKIALTPFFRVGEKVSQIILWTALSTLLVAAIPALLAATTGVFFSVLVATIATIATVGVALFGLIMDALITGQLVKRIRMKNEFFA